MREREGLIARIRQIRRMAVTPVTRPPRVEQADVPIGLPALQSRIEHLERLVEALQDSVHRDSERYGKRIAELENRLQPSALGVALSKDARERGL